MTHRRRTQSLDEAAWFDAAEHAGDYQYERHRPEETVLYRVVSTYWPGFGERVKAFGSLPKIDKHEQLAS